MIVLCVGRCFKAIHWPQLSKYIAWAWYLQKCWVHKYVVKGVLCGKVGGLKIASVMHFTVVCVLASTTLTRGLRRAGIYIECIKRTRFALSPNSHWEFVPKLNLGCTRTEFGDMLLSCKKRSYVKLILMKCLFHFSVEFCEPRLTDYTLKPLGAGLVALRSMKDYKYEDTFHTSIILFILIYCVQWRLAKYELPLVMINERLSISILFSYFLN